MGLSILGLIRPDSPPHMRPGPVAPTHLVTCCARATSTTSREPNGCSSPLAPSLVSPLLPLQSRNIQSTQALASSRSPDGDQRRTRPDRHLQGGEGQAGGGGDALRAVQDAPDLRLPHQAGGAHRDRHQELPPAHEARDRLAATFGYQIRELQRTRAPSNRSSRSSQPPPNVDAKSYVLVSKLDPEVYSKHVEDKGPAHLSGFAFVVISIVHLAGAKISEEDFWHQLKRLGLNETDENHPAFGNNKQALEHLVQQRYLLKEKIAGPEGHFMMYELAERASDESISGKLKDYISQVVGTSTTAEVD